MLGEAAALAVDVPLPEGVTLRRVTAEDDVRAMSAMSDEAFGESPSREMADALLRRLELGTGMQLWVAEADGRIVGAGRLEPVEGSDFAGLWGGAVLRTVAKAGHLPRASPRPAPGKPSPSARPAAPATPPSTPARSWNGPGLIKVSTTTPYMWRR